MAIGALHASTKDLYDLLEQTNGFPDEFKDQLKLLYLSINNSYEKYAIIDISSNENKRIEKIAILLTDSQGNVLRRMFLTPDGVMLQNMYHTLNAADYIAGCDLAAVEEMVRNECEICGDSFSDECESINSDGTLFTVFLEGNYLDVFRRPWISLPSLDSNETDPFRRIYKIKNLIIKNLNDR